MANFIPLESDWTFETLILHVTYDLDHCIKWCRENKLLAKSMLCPVHNQDMREVARSKLEDGGIWRCGKCRKEISFRKGSWFSGSKLSLQTILKLTYMWAVREPIHRMRAELNISQAPATDWYNFCREVCAVYLIENCQEKLGGPGKVVEIDESMFGKRKFHRGRRTTGRWVFRAIERDSRKVRMAVVEQRNKDTLLPLIKDWILPGTTVLSDLWGAYNCLGDEGFVHDGVNHSVNFVDPETGAHTQNIENTWSHAKRFLHGKGTSADLFPSHLMEFMWRRVFGDRPFVNILKHIAYVYNVQQPDSENTHE